MNYIGLICARGGSKGLPGKNTKLFHGKSLVGRAVEAARAVEEISKIVISTDSLEISQLAKREGADVPFMRPSDLSEDHSSEWDVWKHMVEYLNDQAVKFKGLVIVPPTAPLRSVEDIKECISLFETGRFDIVITVTNASRSPYFNMVKEIDNGQVDLVIRPDKKYVRRQDVPEVYDMTTVAYVVSPSFVLSSCNMFEGKVGCVHIPSDRAIDIDTQLDFDIAEYIEKNRRI